MKELQKYRVVRAYGPYRVGDIIQPTGMLRDELRACGRIVKHDEPAPATTPEPEPVDDIDIDEPDVLVEAAAVAPVETAARTTGKPRKAARW